MSRRIDRHLLDDVSRQARESPRLRKNLNFHATDDFPAHRLLNAREHALALLREGLLGKLR